MTNSLNKLKENALKNPAVKKEYDRLAAGFTEINKLLKVRKN